MYLRILKIKKLSEIIIIKNYEISKKIYDVQKTRKFKNPKLHNKKVREGERRKETK
jgi:hypothetical protein